MICANCGHRPPAEDVPGHCANCGEDPRLADRYVLREVLGQRGMGSTYLAGDGSRDVVVKEMLLRTSADMKEIELFGREAELLAGLDVEGVPAHYEHFELQRGKTVGLYNVHEYVEGVSLEEELRTRRPSTAEVLDTIADVVDVLARLRRHDPPIVHRDIKPANLVRRSSDGRLFLVDFGVARAVAESLHFAGSTVTGTFGYMAPEQLYGHAEPASDIYALGATAIRMCTGREPHELLDDDRRFAWKDDAAVDGDVADLFDAMTAWAASDRPQNLDRLAADLRARSAGERGALKEYARAHTLVRTRGSDRAIARPRTMTILQELSKDPVIRGGAFARWATMAGLLIILVPLAHPFLKTTIFVICLVQLLLPIVVVPEFRTAMSRLFRYRTGEKVRGIVVDRTNDGNRFRIAYRYDVGGESYTADHEVSADWYFSVEEGDEVDVFYASSAPERSVFHP